MHRIKVALRKLEESLLAMRRYSHHRDIWAMGTTESPQQGVKEFLYHDRLGTEDTARLSSLKPDLVPVLTQTATRLGHRIRESFCQRVNEMPVEFGLLFITHRENMQVFYVLKSGDIATGPVVLSIPGPHMQQIEVLPLEGGDKGAEQTHATSMQGRDSGTGRDASNQEWRQEYERLAVAVGLGDVDRGFELLARARKLVVVDVGMGRAGSRLAFRQGQEGVGAEAALVLVDPDTTGSENLEGMIVAREALELPKVVGVGKTIEAITGGTVQPVCLYASLNDQEVQDVLRMADVLFTAVDEPAVRLAAAVIASRYHILHIDVTGGLAWAGEKRAVAGGELRVFIPGSRGCLGCFDRYDWQDAMRLLGLSSEAERERRQHLNWHQQRPGSNPDILLPVIGEAMQAFWSILRGEIGDSFWLHYHKDHQCRPVWSDWSNRHRWRKWKKCAICGQQSGLGDMIE